LADQEEEDMYAESGYCLVAELLIHHGASLDIADSGGRTPLHVAIFHKQTSGAQLLIESGTALDVVDSEGKTALQMATEMSLESIVQLITERSAADETKR
jgi:ankyrin repeat protein